MKKLGFGAMRLPVIEGDQSRIDFCEMQKMVDLFMSRGFCYFDTAYIYHNGLSEKALRETVVSKYPRDSFMLCDKMPIFLIKNENDYEGIFAEQLNRCGVEYFDMYLLHSITKANYPRLEETGGFEFVKGLRASGKIRRVGFSYHDSAELLDDILAKHPEIEYVQLQINYIDWDCEAIQSRKCYETARRHNKSVIVMEPVKGGALAKVSDEVGTLFTRYDKTASAASWAIRFAASLDGVFTVLSGMSNYAQTDDNTSYMRNFKPLCDEERAIIDAAAGIIKGIPAIPCTACRYCVPHCPKNIAIPDYFSQYNSKKQVDTWVPAFYYKQFAEKYGKASDCIACRACERFCPQHLDIPGCLKTVSELFDGGKND